MNNKMKQEIIHFKNKGYFNTPKICQIEITTVCPLNCSQCYKNLTPKHADYKTLCKRLEDAKNIGVKSIMINGGEPMMHPDFLKIISFIVKDLEMEAYCFLSGYGITKDTGKKFDSNKVHVTFSLNGSTHDVNKKSRDGYNEAVNAIRIFKELKIPCGINWVGRRDNVEDFEQLLKFAEQNHVAWINIISNKLCNGKVHSPMSYDDYQRLCNTIHAYQKTGKVNIQIEGCNSVLNNLLHPKKRLVTFNGCQAGRMTYFIDIDGYYMPCSHLQYKEKYSDALSYWKNSNVLHTLRESNQMTKCNGCQYAADCFFCKATEQETHDDFFKNSKTCILRRKIEREEYI